MDIREVSQLRDDVLWLRDRMPAAMARWSGSRPNCEYNAGLIKDICYRPGILIPEVFDPVIKWLSDYILNREGTMKIVNVDDFLRAGIYRIFRFITVADFFAKNPQYFTPYVPPQDFNAYAAASKAQADYREFINLLSEKLIGCNDKLHFIFLKLSKTIPNLTPDLQQMQTYLANHCTFLKVRALERK